MNPIPPNRGPQGSEQNPQRGWPTLGGVPGNVAAIGGNPKQRALRLLGAGRFDEARAVLAEAYDRNPKQFELGRIANLIFPCGMIAEAIDALHRMEGGNDE